MLHFIGRTASRLVPLVLIAGLSTAGLAQAPGLVTETMGTRLEVQARGVVRGVPDRAMISAGVVTQAPDAQTALRRNAEQMAKLLAALRAAGIADKDIRTQSIALTPQYRYPANEAPVLTGYQANNSLAISIAEIARVGGVIDVLVKQGANEINGPHFVLSQRPMMEDQARQEAVRQFQARAALYAKALGLHVRRILSLSEAVEPAGPTMPFLMARVAAAEPKTTLSAGQEDVAVTVSGIVELGAKP
jgi:uncharacterized protein YggE